MALEEAIKPPTDGFWNVLTDRWWCVDPEKGLLFYGTAPQCNRQKSIALLLASKCWPDAEIIQIPVVYLKHDCADYR
jgi:hypothetical protein